MANKSEGLIGKIFGRWKVIDNIDVRRCLCECECGTIKPVQKTHLKSGASKSCGCLKNEYTSKKFKKYNEYNLSGSYGIGYTENNEEFYFDLEDYEKIKDYCWSCNIDGYLISTKNSKTIRLHRMIMNCNDSNIYVDHINHDVKDNRKLNLRLVKNSQNQMNAKLRSNNTSNYTGVYYKQKIDKWIANIQYNRKRIFLGQFDNLENAVKARKEAEEKYFGEYSYDNSMKASERNIV